MKMLPSWMWRCCCIALILLVWTTTANSQVRTIIVGYALTGTDSDAKSIAALKYTVALLNHTAPENTEYILVNFPTFEDAIEYSDKRAERNVHKVYLVSHGVFDPATGAYSGKLRDTKPNSTPDVLVDGNFNKSFHCDKNGNISNHRIGREIAEANGHQYPVTTGDSSENWDDGSAPPYTGGGGYWVKIDVQVPYRYWSDSGWQNAMMPSAVWIWQPEGNPNVGELALNKVPGNPYIRAAGGIFPENRTGPMCYV